MLVRDVMSAPVEVLAADVTCAAAYKWLVERSLRRAPVVKAGRMVGMVTLSDLEAFLPATIAELDASSEASHRAHHTPVLAAATTEVRQLAPNDSIELAARSMLRHKIGVLPVIDATDGRHELLGIVTESDIFKLFVRRTLSQRGHRLILRAPAKPLAELDPARICAEARAQLFDLGMYPLDGGRTSCTLRVRAPDLDNLLERFGRAGYERVLVERD